MNKITLIDGGLSTELADMGFAVGDSKLWTAKWLIENPDVLKNAHLNFIKAGCEIIETSSYQLSVENLKSFLNISNDDARKLIKKTAEIAQQAREESKNENIKIAGSIGPLGACKCDGSEFDGSYANDLTIDYLKDWHRPRLECLIEAKCDLIAIETVPSIREASAIIELLSEYPDLKAWLSLSCKDGFHLCNGDSFKEAFHKFKDNRQLIAIGINCTSPYHIESLLQSAERNPTDIPFIAYSNDGKIWDSETKTFKGTESNQIDVVYKLLPNWFKLGVKYIGGCCNIGSKDLVKFKEIIGEQENF